MVRIKGVNIWPEACAEVVRGLPDFNGQYYCILETVGDPPRDTIRILLEAAEEIIQPETVAPAAAAALRRAFDVRIDVEVVGAGALTGLTRYGIDNKVRRFEDRRRR
jgi:phenylacetate-CoA ligase